jgi:ERCC4-type nuclease
MVVGVNPQEAANHPEILNYLVDNKVPIEERPMEIGDFTVEGLEEALLIERKSLQDFYSSLLDRRLFDQAKWMAENKGKGYTPIEIVELNGLGNLVFDSKTRKRKFVETWVFKENEARFYSAQVGLAKFGVGLVLTSDPLGTARFLRQQNDKLGEPKERKEYPERGGFRKNMSLKERKLYLVEAFGLEVGKALARDYPNVAAMTHELGYGQLMRKDMTPEALINNIANIKLDSGRRIGPVKAKQIFEVCFT